MTTFLNQARKAIVAGIGTGVAVYGTIAGSGVHVDPLIAVGAAVGAGLVMGVIVWITPNPAPPTA